MTDSAAPTVESACPSCGRVAVRHASSWVTRTDGTMTLRVACEPRVRAEVCWRVFDVEVKSA